MEKFDEDIENTFPIISPVKMKTEAELLRERNIKEREAFFASLLKDPEFAEAVEAINSAYKDAPAKRKSSIFKVKTKRRSTGVKDEPFKFFGRVPSERRQSCRLQNIAPLYTEQDLIDDSYVNRRKTFNGFRNDSDYDDIEAVVFVPPKKRKTPNKGRTTRLFIPVEEVTEAILSKVVKRVSDKQYSDSGTSCHQCRQKTTDQKTCCRSEECFGVRGQFCGVCLENRYGEDAIKALKDPNWHCPVCRGICNCSFCRTKEGKRPTGILAPLAQKYGHKSVKDFLDSLRGEGDYADDTKDPKKLLGFSKDLCFAQMGGGVKQHLEYNLSYKKLKMYIEQFENNLPSFPPYEPVYLLGFENNFAKFDIGKTDLSCNCCFYLREFIISSENLFEDSQRGSRLDL